MIRKAALILALLLLWATAVSGQEWADTLDRRASFMQGATGQALTFCDRSAAALTAGDTAQAGRDLRQCQGRIKALRTNTLVLRALIAGYRDMEPGDTVVPPPVDTLPTPPPADTTPTPPPVEPPPPSDTVTWNRRLDGVIVGDLVVPNGERWLIGNLQIEGNLRTDGGTIAMRPGSSLRFIGATRSQYVGGGMRYVDAFNMDYGIWVGGTGKLDISCTPKQGWNRTGSHSTWSTGDELWIAPTAHNDIAPRRWSPGQPIPQAHALTPPAEVINVSRDCSITGPGHIHISSNQPSRIEYVRLQGMGITRTGRADHIGELLTTGRYALHFHFQGEGSHGTIVRGVAAVDSRGRVFVPHESHGITFEDNVSVNSWGEAFWWDHGDKTNDVTVDRLAVSGVYAPRDSTGVTSYVNGVILMFGERMSMSNSVVSGVGNTEDSHGYNWPEHPECNCESSVWDFRGNVAHNNGGRGLRFWVNDADVHDVHGLVTYRNGAGGIENGAYLNSVRYFDSRIIEDHVQHKASSRGRDDDGGPAMHVRSTIIARTGPALTLGPAALPPFETTLFEDVTLHPAGSAKAVEVLPNENPIRVRFRNAKVGSRAFVASDIQWPTPIPASMNGSSVTIETGTQSVVVRVENGRVASVEPTSPTVAELPRVRLNTAYVEPSGSVHRVASGGNLQAALDAARSGDVVELQAGASFRGAFTLPPKIGADWIVVRSSAFAQLPEGVRVGPQHAHLMPRLIGGRNNEPVIRAGIGSQKWRLVGLEVAADSTGLPPILNTLVSLYDSREIVIDRSYIHARPETEILRCVLLNSASSAVIDSYLSECHAKGFDSQAILAWDTPGPLKIANNYLEGAGENVMFGGADPRSAEMVPADIEFVRNDLVKPAAWFTSGRWSVKNLFEIKTATRVLVEGNTFDGNWTDAQTGVALLLMSTNQDGGTGEWSKATDITIRRNLIRNSESGITFSDRWGTVAEPLSRVVFEDNRFESMGSESVSGRPGRLVQLLGSMPDLVIRHNSAGGGLSNQVVFEGQLERFVFENNIVGPSEYGFQNASLLGTMAPGAVVRGNILAPAAFNVGLPAGNCVAWPPETATACPSAGAR